MRTGQDQSRGDAPYPDRRFTTQQAAEFLGLREQTLINWRCTGRYDLPFVKMGRLVFYFESDLREFIARRRATNTGQYAAM